MRPEALFPLFAPVTSLPGVGPRLAKLVERVAGQRVVDLVWHLPGGLIDRRYAPKLAAARPGVVATLTVRVDRHRPPRNPRQPYKVLCSDETGTLAIVFFHAHADYLARTLPEGEVRVVSTPGVGTSFILELLVYPPIYALWKWRYEMKHGTVDVSRLNDTAVRGHGA